jgi:hypothetical protein
VPDCGEACLNHVGGHGVEALARGWEYWGEVVNDRFGPGRGRSERVNPGKGTSAFAY